MSNCKTGCVLGLVMAATAPAAFAGDADLQLDIYGTLLPFIDHTSISDGSAGPSSGRPNQVAASAYSATESDGERVTGGTSNLGFKGSYALGQELKVIFQIESQIPIDGTQGPEGNLASRNSQVGLEGSWGSAFVGQWDTPYKWTTMQLAPMRGINPFDYDNLLENPGFGVPGTTTQGGRSGGKTDAAFSRRQSNSVQYWSPSFDGFSLRLGYSFDESRQNLDSNTTTSPTIASLAVQYVVGGLTLRYAFEQHDDYFGLSQIGGSAGATATNPGSQDRGHKLAVFYSFARTRIAGAYERLEYQSDDGVAGAVDEYRRDAWFLTVNQKLTGPHGLWLSYGSADAGDCELVGGGACATSGLGARMYSLGYTYDLNDKAKLYAAYYGVDTDDSSQYGIFPSPTAVSAGADSKAFGLGFIVSFGGRLIE